MEGLAKHQVLARDDGQGGCRNERETGPGQEAKAM